MPSDRMTTGASLSIKNQSDSSMQFISLVERLTPCSLRTANDITVAINIQFASIDGCCNADKHDDGRHDHKHEGGVDGDDQEFAHEHSLMGISWPSKVQAAAARLQRNSCTNVKV